MKVLYCIFASNRDLTKLLYIHKDLIDEFSKNCEYFKVINFYKYNKKMNYEQKKTNSDFLITEINNIDDFKNIYDTFDKIIAMDCLSKSINIFRIRKLINKKKIKLFQVMNHGFISNASGEHESFTHLKFNIIKKINYFFYRVLVVLNFFPAIDYYFDSRQEIVKNINEKNKNKIKKFFDKFLNIIYFKNSFLINSNSYDQYQFDKINLVEKNIAGKSESIVFLDGNFNHPDIIKREQIDLERIKDIYFKNLKNFFNSINCKQNYTLEICLHPSSNEEIYKKHFDNLDIYKFRTFERVLKSKIVIFHESGSITGAIIAKKKIISLTTNLFGGYYQNRILNYHHLLGTPLYDLDDFDQIKSVNINEDAKLDNPKTKIFLKNYINGDGSEIGKKKIVRILKSF